MKSDSPGKKNWLLRNLIVVSIGIHAVLFMHISGLYNCEAVSYIELTVKDFTKPVPRIIPKPRIRSKLSDQPQNIKKLSVEKQIVPRLDVKKMDRVASKLPDSIAATVSMPDLPKVPGVKISQWQPPPRIETSEHMTIKEYYEMVRLRIQANKQYPENAKTRRIFGRSVVHFKLFPNGEVTTIKIAKSSGSKILDNAALNAVEKSSPFPKPPGALLSQPVTLEIVIAFELI